MNKPDGAPAMSKSKILAEMDNMVFARLFGRGPWLADRESCVALQTKLEQMGLEERVPGERDTWRNTPLGKELHSHLVMVSSAAAQSTSASLHLLNFSDVKEATHC
jgi:hypothetical protein